MPAAERGEIEGRAAHLIDREPEAELGRPVEVPEWRLVMRLYAPMFAYLGFDQHFIEWAGPPQTAATAQADRCGGTHAPGRASDDAASNGCALTRDHQGCMRAPTG